MCLDPNTERIFKKEEKNVSQFDPSVTFFDELCYLRR